MSLLANYNTLYTGLATLSGVNIYTSPSDPKRWEFPFVVVRINSFDDATNFSTDLSEFTRVNVSCLIGESIAKDRQSDDIKTGIQNLINRTIEVTETTGMRIENNSDVEFTIANGNYGCITMLTGII